MLKEIVGKIRSFRLEKLLSSSQAVGMIRLADDKAREKYEQVKQVVKLEPKLAGLVLFCLTGLIASELIEINTTNIFYTSEDKERDRLAIQQGTETEALEYATSLLADNNQAARDAVNLAQKVAGMTLDLLDQNYPKKRLKKNIQLQLLPICNQLQELWRNSQERTFIT